MDHAVAVAKASAFAPGTAKNFKSQWSSYYAFCRYYSLVPLPCTLENLCRYITFMASSLKSYQSLKKYVNGLKVLHKCYSMSVDIFLSFDVKLVLQCARKEMGIINHAKLPISPSILLAIRRFMDLSKPDLAALWCAFLVAFFAFLRKSNLVPRSRSTFDPLMNLSRGSFQRTTYGLLITLEKTKTVQCKERLIQIPLTCIPGSLLDPVAAYDHMCQLIPAPATTPAFSFPSASGLSTITHSSLTARLRALLKDAGYEPSRYAGHSFRRGGCTCAFLAQVPTELLQAHGDWHSSAYLKYLTVPINYRLQVTERMSRVLNLY